MKIIGWFATCCLLLVTAGACKVDRPSLRDDGPERSCQAPKLTVVGHAHQRGPLTVHPGQTLRLRGIHYTDACHVSEAGTATTIPRVQLALQSKMRVGPIATVHPRGPDSAFTTVVEIPSTTFPGRAEIFDSLSSPHGVVRLAVRR